MGMQAAYSQAGLLLAYSLHTLDSHVHTVHAHAKNTCAHIPTKSSPANKAVSVLIQLL